MTGLEDLHEPPRPTNRAPTIALGAAAVLLLIVAGMSYHRYMENKYEEREKEKLSQLGYAQPGYGQPAQGYPAGQPGQMPPNQAYPQPPAGGQFPQAVQNPPNYNPAAVPTQPVAPVADPVQDAQISQMQEDLARMKKQTEETEKRYNDLARQMEREAQDLPAPTPGAISPEVPSFLETDPASPAAGAPAEVQDTISRMKRQVQVAPSLGKVMSYDNEWGIVTFDAGSTSGVLKQQRFAVRRGSDILGWVRVEEVYETESVAVLVTKNADSDISLKPQVGDDLIQFEL